MLPRRQYREVARALAEISDDRAQAGVSAINNLLDERARLANRVIRAEGLKTHIAAEDDEECTPKARRSLMRTLFGWMRRTRA